MGSDQSSRKTETINPFENLMPTAKRKSIDNVDEEDTVVVVTGEFGDGSAGVPSVTFTSDPDTGIYKDGTDTIAITTAGTKRRAISTTAETFTLQQLGGGGSASAPTYSFSTDPDSGIYSTGSNQVGISAGNTVVWSSSSTGSTYTVPLRASDGSATLPSVSFANLTGAGLYNETATANTMGLATGNAKRGQLNSTALAMSVPITTSSTTESTTPGTGSIVTAGGLGVAKNINFAGQALGEIEGAGAPTYSFTADPDTGKLASRAWSFIRLRS